MNARVRSAVLSGRRRVAFAIAAAVVAATASLVLLFVFDIYLHTRLQALSGLNVWGYRGPALGRKRAGELRLAALGGSTVFGYGLPWDETWPAVLERRLNALQHGRTIVSVANLGIPGDSAQTFVSTLTDYAYLNSDIVILYEGYNDLGLPPARNATVPAGATYLSWRHQSPIFRWTGYFPVFPLVLTEKAMSLTHRGNLAAAYASRDIVFTPGLATRATAAALKASADVALAIETRFGRLSATAPADSGPDPSCGRWSRYCSAIDEAIRYAVARHQRVMVVSQPFLSDLHVGQQRALAANVAREFGGNRSVRYVDLGRAVDLRDPALSYDRMHLTAAGDDRVATALSSAVLDLIN